MRTSSMFAALIAAGAVCLGLTQCKAPCEDSESCGVYPALPYCDGIWRMRADGSACSYCPKRDEDDGAWYWPDHGDEWVLEAGREFFLPLKGEDDPNDPRLCGTAEDGCDQACPDMGVGGTGGNADSGGAAGTAAGGTAAGTSGAAGDSSGGNQGVGGGGGTAGSGGTLGVGGTGTGGTGGEPPVPCDGACGGNTPICDEGTDNCVECLKTSDCNDGVCDIEANICVECLDPEDCEAPTPLCDTEGQLCVECLENNDCTNTQESACDAGSCSPCQTNDDCAHLTGTTVCDEDAGECVECTGTDYASCGLNDDDEQLVCNTLTRTCSDDQVEQGSGLCEPCVSDANCDTGELCMEQFFQGQSVGYFCHWVEGDTEHGAPAECGANGRPYVEQLADATSIDSQVATVCGLRTSTCPARTQFSAKDCVPEGTPDDSLCGVDPPNDAKCVQFSASTYFCTMRCLAPIDCPGTDCLTGLGEPVCDL